ncbi:MAG: BamA/OMP85 family outer membrane protein [Marinilabiliaceae bacterium]
MFKSCFLFYSYRLVPVIWFLFFVFSTNAQENAEIRKIRIEGNETFNKGELLEQISFSEVTWLKKTLFKKEPTFFTSEAWDMNKGQLRSFYQSEGFLHVEIGDPDVDLNTRNYKVELSFEVEENSPVVIDSVDFVTEKKGRNDELLKGRDWNRLLWDLEAGKGKRFRDDQVRNDQDRIASWLSSQGYAYASVEPSIGLSADTLKANVSWQIKKGPICYFGDISVEGAERTPEEAIRKQFAFEKGDVYSSKKLSQSQRYVYELGLFRIASLQARRRDNQQRDTIPVELTIQEAPRLSTRYGVGYGREDRFRTFVDLRYLNFPGPTQRTKFYAKHSGLEPYRFKATFTQPAVFGPNSSMAFSPYIRVRDEVGFESFLWGSDLSLHQSLGDDLTASASLYFEQVDIEVASTYERFPGDQSISTYSKNGVSLGMLYNNARPRFDPVGGWSLAFNTRTNSSFFQSPYPFIKYIFEAKRYQPLTNGVVLALRLKAGSIIPTGDASSVPVEERFFAGGSQSVRGWARQMLGPLDGEGVPVGGRSLLEGSLEPRVKIVDPVSIVGFLDYGNVWSEENRFDPGRVRFAAGGGIRVSTPIGPVGIDMGKPVFNSQGRWQFHLNIGHAF